MLILDEIRTANWMQSKDGAKNRNRPKPVSPLVRDDRSKKVGGTDLPQEQVREWLKRIGPAERTNGNSDHHVDGEVSG